MYPTLSSLLLLGVAATTTLAACPYADKFARSGESCQREQPERRQAAADKKGVFYMNRIGPSASTLYIANADGSNERALLASNDSIFEYHGHFAPDGQSVTFTSERIDGNADLYQVNLDGSSMKSLLATPSFEDHAEISPDGTKLAYISTANNYVSNVWVMDLASNGSAAYNLTNTAETAGVASSPDGHYRPRWSPDGEWILFTSDRNTDWTGHSNGTGWEHTQELSVYAIRPNGTDFKQVVAKAGYCLGSANWSPDGSRVVFYEMTLEATYGAHTAFEANATTSQIVSVDFATGIDRVEHTSGDGLKLGPSYVSDTTIGYLAKGVAEEGINYTSYDTVHQQFLGGVRNPSWSADGSMIIYEKTSWDIRPLEKTLYSWQSDYEYRFMDVFPLLSLQNRLAYTQKQTGGGNSSIITSAADGTDIVETYDTFASGAISISDAFSGLAGAFQPSWSPDGEWVAFGVGFWFTDRVDAGGLLYRATANGSYSETITDGSYNAGFPSYSPDGTQLVFRAWDNSTGGPLGLKIMDMTTGAITNLTYGWDNTPGWSPDGTKIVFARNTNWTAEMGARWEADRFDVCTISPDGTDLQVLTTSGANDAHAVWTADNKIMYNSGQYGFRDECAVYDETFQPYGQLIIMEKDGSNKTMLTDSMWEDSMPLYVPN